MLFRTEVALEPSAVTLDTTSHVLLLGSCFAEEVGQRLNDSLPEGAVCVNPCGVLYNPESIAQALHLLLMSEAERRRTVENSLFLAHDGLWHSWLFSTKYAAAEREDCLVHCLDSLGEGLSQPNLLVLTLGTDHCYRLKADRRVVANCHKEPASLFDEDVMADFAALYEVLAALHARFPELQVLVTVSPYRYAKYGFHQSQLSKSRLLLLADALVRQFAWVTYFPAYEIVLDELRDYRFYASDMLHPSEQAADYIFERFSDWCFTPALKQYAIQRQKELKRQRHRKIRD